MKNMDDCYAKHGFVITLQQLKFAGLVGQNLMRSLKMNHEYMQHGAGKKYIIGLWRAHVVSASALHRQTR